MKRRLCSFCGAHVAYDGRTTTLKALPHREWRVNGDGPYESTVDCEGAGRGTHPIESLPALVAERFGPPIEAADEAVEVIAARRAVLLGEEGR